MLEQHPVELFKEIISISVTCAAFHCTQAHCVQLAVQLLGEMKVINDHNCPWETGMDDVPVYGIHIGTADLNIHPFFQRNLLEIAEEMIISP